MQIPDIIGCGIFDSRIAMGGKAKSSPRKVKFYEIEYYPENGKSSFIDGAEYPIKEGNIIVAKPGQVRYSKLHMRNCYLWLAPCGGEVCSMLSSLPDVMNASDGKTYEVLFSDIRKWRENPSRQGEFFGAARVMELIYTLFSDGKSYRRTEGLTSGDTKGCRGIAKASEYMDKNYFSKITLENAAKQASLSPTYFHRLFSAVMGKTPREYLLECRLSAAKDMLLSAETLLTEVAYECGFGSQSYFNSVFRREMGMTPSEYRKKMLDLPEVKR